MSSLTMPK